MLVSIAQTHMYGTCGRGECDLYQSSTRLRMLKIGFAWNSKNVKNLFSLKRMGLHKALLD